ncbi:MULTISPECIES: glycosyltransferase family 2 protein [Emticicia]|uniref:glycosyltransferase family 2 protein n=1 Tax=Emticicia TaxID=312278 RepID=UPI000C771053|nr:MULTISPECIES: glycosyltransferase family 2 protein [Emticicia]PLK45498.1 glycosyl transferase family 2 [Emticicia sp. TH156]
MDAISLPGWVKQILSKPLLINQYTESEIDELKNKLARFNVENPVASILIPAWNEEEGILHTLISLANTNTEYPTELIIVDNNSTDGTNALLKRLGINVLFEEKQGVGHARIQGLHKAKGKYLLSADSDTLYPPGWINAMINALKQGEKDNVYCVHGTYAFLPSDKTPRWQYGIYEFLSGFVIRKNEKNTPYLNVLGYNSAFITQKGIEVNGYDIPVQRTFRGIARNKGGYAAVDGMMGYRLMEAGGKIAVVSDYDAKVWTNDRRIQIDGGIWKALVFRVQKHLFKK